MKYTIAALAASAVMITGCIDYDGHMTVNDDGSGRMELKVTIPKDTLDAIVGLSSDQSAQQQDPSTPPVSIPAHMTPEILCDELMLNLSQSPGGQGTETIEQDGITYSVSTTPIGLSDSGCGVRAETTWTAGDGPSSTVPNMPGDELSLRRNDIGGWTMTLELPNPQNSPNTGTLPPELSDMAHMTIDMNATLPGSMADTNAHDTFSDGTKTTFIWHYEIDLSSTEYLEPMKAVTRNDTAVTDTTATDTTSAPVTPTTQAAQTDMATADDSTTDSPTDDTALPETTQPAQPEDTETETQPTLPPAERSTSLPLKLLAVLAATAVAIAGVVIYKRRS